jgi:hypothetical protein
MTPQREQRIREEKCHNYHALLDEVQSLRAQLEQVEAAQRVMQQFAHIYPDGFPGDWQADASKLESQVTFLCNRQRTEFQTNIELRAQLEQKEREIARLRVALETADAALELADAAMRHGNQYTMTDAGSEEYSKAQKAVKQALTPPETKEQE